LYSAGGGESIDCAVRNQCLNALSSATAGFPADVLPHQSGTVAALPDGFDQRRPPLTLVRACRLLVSPISRIELSFKLPLLGDWPK
jgi:hypothetical protein